MDDLPAAIRVAPRKRRSQPRVRSRVRHPALPVTATDVVAFTLNGLRLRSRGTLAKPGRLALRTSPGLLQGKLKFVDALLLVDAEPVLKPTLRLPVTDAAPTTICL